MSFSGEIKEELSTLVPAAHHCRLAETAAILLFCGKIILTETDSCCVKIQTENLPVARKYFTLLRKTFNMRAEVSVRKSREIRYYSIVIRCDKDARRLLAGTHLMNPDGHIDGDIRQIHNSLLKQNCCRRSFIRGAFLAAGSVSDPEKSSHFEKVCSTHEKAE